MVKKAPDDDEDSFGEDPLESDQDSTDEVDTVPCTFCGRSVAEIADICPGCGNFISRDDLPPERKPIAMVIAAIVLILVFSGVIALVFH